jgi:hypothetical protein
MSSDVKELEDRIKELERKVEALTDECEHLGWRVSTLRLAKLSDPRYPFWNWQLQMMESEAMRTNLDIVLGALNDRAAGDGTPDEMKKDIEGVPHELLYGSDPLKLSDVFQAIKLTTGLKHDSQVVDCIKALNEQGMMLRQLRDFVLSALDE